MRSALGFDPWAEIRDLRQGAAKVAKPAKAAATATVHAKVRSGRELLYPLGFVRQEVLALTPPYRERYWEWVQVFEADGYSREHAERAAYRRLITSRHRPLDTSPSLSVWLPGADLGSGCVGSGLSQMQPGSPEHSSREVIADVDREEIVTQGQRVETCLVLPGYLATSSAGRASP